MEKPYAYLYHCNEAEKCKKFVEDKSQMINSVEDGIWLGNGMYFWDNISNAQYWKSIKIKKDGKNSYCIVKAGIYLDKVLDLTDIEISRKIGKIWDAYIKKCGCYKKNEELGKKLNILFDYCLKTQYNVIKIYGKYNLTPFNNLWKFNFETKKAEPTSNVKCIYSVKDDEPINEVELVK